MSQSPRQAIFITGAACRLIKCPQIAVNMYHVTVFFSPYYSRKPIKNLLSRRPNQHQLLTSAKCPHQHLRRQTPASSFAFGAMPRATAQFQPWRRSSQ